MEDICPMCGRTKEGNRWETRIPTDPLEIEDQIDSLGRVFDGLKNHEGGLMTLIEDRYEMCPMCFDLMEGVESEGESEKLEKRIHAQVEHLEERFEVSAQGLA